MFDWSADCRWSVVYVCYFASCICVGSLCGIKFVLIWFGEFSGYPVPFAIETTTNIRYADFQFQSELRANLMCTRLLPHIGMAATNHLVYRPYRQWMYIEKCQCQWRCPDSSPYTLIAAGRINISMPNSNGQNRRDLVDSIGRMLLRKILMHIYLHLIHSFA